VVASHNNMLYKYDLKTKKVIAEVSIDNSEVNDIIFSKNRVGIAFQNCIIVTDENL
jgi:hypothetical protein